MEVSTDNGHSWHTALLNTAEVIPDDSSKSWNWLRWTATVPVTITPKIPTKHPTQNQFIENTTNKLLNKPRRALRKRADDPRTAPVDAVNVPVLAVKSGRSDHFLKGFVFTAAPASYSPPSSPPSSSSPSLPLPCPPPSPRTAEERDESGEREERDERDETGEREEREEGWEEDDNSGVPQVRGPLHLIISLCCMVLFLFIIPFLFIPFFK